MAASQTSLHMQDVLKTLRNPNVRVGDGRRHKRAKCFLLASVQHAKYTCECIVENLSIGGCKVNNTNGQLAVGQRVIISIPEQQMSLNGMVMWVRGLAAGLCFNLSV